MAHFLEQGECKICVLLGMHGCIYAVSEHLPALAVPWMQRLGLPPCRSCAVLNSLAAPPPPLPASDLIPTFTYYVGITFNLVCLALCWRYPRRAEPEVGWELAGRIATFVSPVPAALANRLWRMRGVCQLSQQQFNLPPFCMAHAHCACRAQPAKLARVYVWELPYI